MRAAAKRPRSMVSDAFPAVPRAHPMRGWTTEGPRHGDRRLRRRPVRRGEAGPMHATALGPSVAVGEARRSAYSGWRRRYVRMNGHSTRMRRPRARTSSSADRTSREPSPRPWNATSTSVCSKVKTPSFRR